MAQEAFELRLRRVEACEAIRKLIATYALGADRNNDPSLLGPLFAPDGVWEAEGLVRLCGRDEIANGLAGLAHDFVTWSLHYMISPLIELGEDARSASCRWYLWELCTMNQAAQTEQGEQGAADTWYGGWYDSSLSLHGDVWLFDHVRLVPRIASANTTPWDGKVLGVPELPPSFSTN